MWSLWVVKQLHNILGVPYFAALNRIIVLEKGQAGRTLCRCWVAPPSRIPRRPWSCWQPPPRRRRGRRRRRPSGRGWWGPGWGRSRPTPGRRRAWWYLEKLKGNTVEMPLLPVLETKLVCLYVCTSTFIVVGKRSKNRQSYLIVCCHLNLYLC